MSNLLTTKHPLWRLAFVTAVFGFLTLLLWQTVSAEVNTPMTPMAGSCASPDIDGSNDIIETDATFSGDVYIDADVIVRDNATITLTAGTRFIFCDVYDLNINGLFSPGRIVAQGTASEPITFEPDNGVANWGSLNINDPIEPMTPTNSSLLEHVIVRKGGGQVSPDTAALAVTDSDNKATAAVVLNYVTVEDSANYGVDLYHREESDPSPVSVSNLTISNSANNPLIVDASNVDGLKMNIDVTNNITSRILVRGSSLNGGMFYDTVWRDHGVPYELAGSVYLRDADADVETGILTWRIEPGVTMLMHPEADITVGSLFGSAKVDWRGTAEEPITITRLDNTSAPWGSLNFDVWNLAQAHKIEHTIFEFGGDIAVPAEDDGTINKSDESVLTLDNVTIRNSQNFALSAGNDSLRVNNSLIENNRAGIYVVSMRDVVIRNTVFQNNVEVAIENNWPWHGCVDAIGNFWDSANGPNDPSDANDVCRSVQTSQTNSSNGANVTDGVRYEPWLATDGNNVLDRSRISVEPFWIIADGVQTGTVQIQLLGADGLPLVNKMVALDSSIGTVTQATSPTDADGYTTAVISSTTAGYGYLTARNVTDDTAVAGIGGVNFWDNPGSSNLIDPSGVPYAFPQLSVIEPPFYQGTPIDFRLPLRNANATPVDVEVVYAVTGLNVGASFSPVYTASKTLQPGEVWSADGVWLPNVTGHRCIQATINVDERQMMVDTVAPEPDAPDTAVEAMDATNAIDLSLESALLGTNFTRQRNTDQNPCNVSNTSPRKFHPGKPAFNSRKDMKKVVKHFRNMANLWGKATKCLDQSLTFDRANSNTLPHEELYTLPPLMPFTIAPDADITVAHAQALNDLAALSTETYNLSVAIGATAQRMHWAAQAGDVMWIDKQYAAYRQFQVDYANKLNELADALDAYAVTAQNEGLADANIYPADYQADLDELLATGYDAETTAVYQGVGLTAEQIANLEADTINMLENINYVPLEFYTMVDGMSDNARDIAADILARYGTSDRSLANGPVIYQVDPMTFDFEVGHPFDTQEDVELRVRPVSLPVDWTYELSDATFTLDAEQLAEAQLTLIPRSEVVEGYEVKLAVEGYVNDEYVGGIMFEYEAPMVSKIRGDSAIYLPLITR